MLSGLQGMIPVPNISVPTSLSPKPIFDPTFLTEGFPLGGGGLAAASSLNSGFSTVKKMCLFLARGPRISPPAAQTSSHLSEDLARQCNHEADWSEGKRPCLSDSVLGIFSSFFYSKAFFLPQPALKNLISGLITTPYYAWADLSWLVHSICLPLSV